MSGVGALKLVRPYVKCLYRDAGTLAWRPFPIKNRLRMTDDIQFFCSKETIELHLHFLLCLPNQRKEFVKIADGEKHH